MYGLIGLFASDFSEIKEWTEDVIKLILKHKGIGKHAANIVKELFSEFNKGQESREFCSVKLSDDTLNKIKSLSNPYNYFG